MDEIIGDQVKLESFMNDFFNNFFQDIQENNAEKYFRGII